MNVRKLSCSNLICYRAQDVTEQMMLKMERNMTFLSFFAIQRDVYALIIKQHIIPARTTESAMVKFVREIDRDFSFINDWF